MLVIPIRSYASSIDVTTAQGIEAAIDYANQGNADTLVLVEAGPYFMGPVEINVPMTIVAGSSLTSAPRIVASDTTDANDFIKVNNDLTLDGVVVDGKYGDTDASYAKIKYMIKIPDTEDEGSPNVAPNLIVKNSVLQNVYKLGTTEGAADGTILDVNKNGRAGVILFENTLIQNTGDEALRAQNAYKSDHVVTADHGGHFDSFTVRNCTFANVNGSSMKLNGDVDTTNVSPAVLIENVTTYNCGRQIIWSRDLHDVTIRNMVIHTSKLNGTEYSYDGGRIMYVDMDGSSIAHVDTFNIARIVGTDTVTVADEAFVLGGNNKSGSIQTATLDAATIYGYDPEFTDAANGDYTLASSSMVCGLAHDGGALGDHNHAGNCSATPNTSSIDVTTAQGLEAAIDYANQGNAGTLVLVEAGPYFIGPVEINVPMTIVAGSSLTSAPRIVASDTTDANDFIKVNNDLTLDGVVVDGKYGDTDASYAKIKYMIKIPDTEDEGSPNVAPNLIVKNSVLQNVYKLGTTEGAADGTILDVNKNGRAGVILFENTLIQNTGDEALRAQNAYKSDHVVTADHGGHFDSFTVRNCTFANVNGSSMKLNGDVDTTNVSPAVLIENVTTYNCGRQIIWSRDLHDVTIRNMVIHTSKLNGTEYSYDGGRIMYVDMDGSSIAHVDTFNIARIVGTDTVTVADEAFVLGGNNKSGSIQTATLDAATIYGYDPEFTDAANGDYTLASSSMVCGLAHDGGALGDHNHAGNCATSMSTIDDDYIPIANGFLLMQNYPNPFNPNTTIRYVLNQDSRVTLKIFDVTGRLIDTLVDDKKAKGFYVTKWNANVPAGMYIYQLSVDGNVANKKMLLLK